MTRPSARTGVLEAAVGLHRLTPQLLALPAIAWRPVIAWRFDFGRQRRLCEASEIAKIAQGPLQLLRRPVNVTEFAVIEHRNGARHRLQHIAEMFCPDPQCMTLGRAE